MVAELGHFALVLALVASAVQATLPHWGIARRDAGIMALAPTAALAQLALITLSFACLTAAFVASDFSLLLVYENSHTAKPMLYKVTGVWGNHEGSMLLWILILALFGAAVAAFGRNLPDRLRTRVLAVHGLIGVAFLSFILFTSNPFARLDPAPIEGLDLNPLLQDPGLAFHPPLLYLGYVGFSMAFSFAVAALIDGRVDPAWARWVRPWTLAAWCGLTMGIALGSWWAYYELGWGGWWFWDPVENASLLPWLSGTALLHSAIVVEKRDALKSWTLLLAILTFSLSLLGTFLVRSGVLTSVHAFAVDPDRGLFILVLILLTTGGALALYAWRAPQLKVGGLFHPISREGALVLNNLLLATATATVFIGTLYPLLLEAIDGSRVSVGPPFFNATFIPLMIPLMVAMAIGPLMAWKRSDLGGVLGRLKVAAVLTAIVALGAAWLATGAPVLAAIGMAAAAWAFLGAFTEIAERIRLFRVPLAASWRRATGLPRASWGAFLAHAGLGIAVAGMTGSSIYGAEAIERLARGDSLEVAGYTLTLDGVEEVEGPNYIAVRAHVSAAVDGRRIAVLTPERRFYPAAGMPTTEVAIRTNMLADLYVALGDLHDDGTWTIRTHYNPLVPWIWIGCLVMTGGGLVSLSDRRLRIGVPVRRRVPAGVPEPAE